MTRIRARTNFVGSPITVAAGLRRVLLRESLATAALRCVLLRESLATAALRCVLLRESLATAALRCVLLRESIATVALRCVLLRESLATVGLRCGQQDFGANVLHAASTVIPGGRFPLRERLRDVRAASPVLPKRQQVLQAAAGLASRSIATGSRSNVHRRPTVASDSRSNAHRSYRCVRQKWNRVRPIHPRPAYFAARSSMPAARK